MVRAIQFDVELPSWLQLTNLNLNHFKDVSFHRISFSAIKGINTGYCYIVSNASLPRTESIINFPNLNSNLISGDYSLFFSNVILSNCKSEC
jgi:hypothetical protein